MCFLTLIICYLSSVDEVMLLMMVNQAKDTLPIVKYREHSCFLFNSELCCGHICEQTWMGMVSFMRSPVVGTF